MKTKPEIRGYDVSVGVVSILILVLAGASLYVPLTGMTDAAAEAAGDTRGRAGPPETGGAAPGVVAGPTGDEEEQVGGTELNGETTDVEVAARPSEAPVAEPATPVEDSTGAPSPAIRRAREAVEREEWNQALQLYASLLQQSPDRAELRLERARVLSWAGRHAEAARAFEEVATERTGDADLLLQAARNWWWAGSPRRAADLLESYLQSRPDDRDALDLRAQVRGAIDPDPATAREWLEESDGGAEKHLWLARAYARDGETRLALPHYREALAAESASDSLLLEYASVAERAGRVNIAIEALERYLDRHPSDRDVRLRLARVLIRAGRTDEGLRVYEQLIEEEGDRIARFERAQTLAWSGRHDRARRALAALIEDYPSDGPILALMGDVERWDGRPEEALEYYRRAVRSGFDTPDLREGMQLAQSSLRERMARREEEARDVGMPDRVAGGEASAEEESRRDGWQARTGVFADSDDFQWITIEAVGPQLDIPGSVQFDVHRDFWSGQSLGGETERSGGWGAGARLTADLASRLEGSLRLGTHVWDDGATEPEWEMGLRFRRTSGGSTSLLYRRVPAVDRAYTSASLRTATVADVLQLREERALGSSYWLSGHVQAERVDSDIGSGERYSAAASVTRSVRDRFTAGMQLAAVASNAAAPLLEGWGRVFWTPDHYIAPELIFRYRQELSPSLRVQVHFDPGYAFVREFPLQRRRYDGNRVPYLDTGMELTYTDDRWTMGVSGGWAGAVDAGYRAARLQFWITSAGSR